MAQSCENLADGDIVQRVLKGDTESFGILFERYHNLVYRLALMNLGDADMAQDITQEAFLRAYNNLDRLRDIASFSAWIAGIARNLCRNTRRSKASQAVSLDYLAEEGIEPPDPGSPLPFQDEQMEAVKRALPSLPYKYREIMELRYTEEYSCKKIASFLNLSASAVKSRLFYARNLILKKLKKEGFV